MFRITSKISSSVFWFTIHLFSRESTDNLKQDIHGENIRRPVANAIEAGLLIIDHLASEKHGRNH